MDNDDTPDHILQCIDDAFNEGGPREAIATVRDACNFNQPPHTPGQVCAACVADRTAELLTYILNKWN
jgi:hypothetical protein